MRGAYRSWRCRRAMPRARSSQGGTRRSTVRSPMVWTPVTSSWLEIVDERLSNGDRPRLIPDAGRSRRVRPARDRDAATDGRGDGLADAARSGGGTCSSWPTTPTDGPGTDTPSGAVQARQDQPELLDVGSERADRRVLRRHRDLQRPDRGRDRRIPASCGSCSGVESSVVHYGDISITFLREPAARRRCRARTDLRLGRRDRGEVGLGLQPGQPSRRPCHARPAGAAVDTARRPCIRRRGRW